MPTKAIRPIRILFQSFAEGWGGAEKFWYDPLLGGHFSETERHVLLPESLAGQKRKALLRDSGTQVHLYSRPPRGFFGKARHAIISRLPWWLPTSVTEPQVHHIRKIQPDLVWFNLGGIGEVGWLDHAVAAVKQLKIPYWIVVQHAPEHYFFPNEDHSRRGGYVLDGAAQVWFVSQRNRLAVERALGRRLTNASYARNAVPHDFVGRGQTISECAQIRTEGTARFVNVARFEPEFKGQHILLEALASQQWRDRDWTLTLQGGGPSGALIERLITYYGLPRSRVKTAERVADVHRVYAEADLLVMPSLSEGTPYAMVEAMVCGRPAVGTPVGGIPELIIDGRTGWLSRSTEMADFSEALDRAWYARKEWPDAGKRARELVWLDYDLDRAIELIMREVRASAASLQD